MLLCACIWVEGPHFGLLRRRRQPRQHKILGEDTAHHTLLKRKPASFRGSSIPEYEIGDMMVRWHQIGLDREEAHKREKSHWMFCVYGPLDLFRFACCFKPLRLDRQVRRSPDYIVIMGFNAECELPLVTVQVACQWIHPSPAWTNGLSNKVQFILPSWDFLRAKLPVVLQLVS